MGKPKIEDIYPLSTLQQALLIHSLSEQSDQGFLQVQCDLKGNLNRELFQAAWQKAVQRHTALRTSIHWEKIEKPLQIVHPNASLSWTFKDWRNLSENKWRTKLAEFKQKDGSQKIDLSKVPISRLALIQIREEDYLLLWTCHHILFDGWSASIILKDVFKFYDEVYNGLTSNLMALPNFKSYLKWVKNLNFEEAAQFWKNRLAEYGNLPTLKNHARPLNGKAPHFRDQSFFLSSSETENFYKLARDYRITVSTFIQSLWGILLSSVLKTNKILFGITVSGRSIDFPNIDKMAGFFSKVLPFGMKIKPDNELDAWFREIQQYQIDSQKYEYVNLDQIQDWTAEIGTQLFFDSLLVFENFPLSDLKGGQLKLERFEGGITTSFPLTVIIKPGESLEFQFRYSVNAIPEELIKYLKEGLKSLLNSILSQELKIVSDLTESRKSLENVPTFFGTQVNSEKFNREIQQNKINSYAPPQNHLELQLIDVWEEVLGVNMIGVNDNFFEIGGSSLVAFQLFGKIEQKLGFNKLPITLIQYPTIRTLANHLQNGDPDSIFPAIVPLKTYGHKSPLFCIHDGAANVLYYKTLLKYLDPEQPVYGIQPIGLDGMKEGLTKIEAMASHYIQEIQEIYPKGPYSLISICEGNAVCFEMAHQLNKADLPIFFVGILDSAPKYLTPPSNTQMIKNRRNKIITRANRRFKRFKNLITDKGFVNAILQKLSVRKNIIEKSIGESKQERILRTIHHQIINATNNYSWQPYKGKITLIRSEEYSVREHHFKKWNYLSSGNLEVHHVPGKHENLFEEPNVQHLAKCIQACMNIAQKGQKNHPLG